jgi:hypothetical protein
MVRKALAVFAIFAVLTLSGGLAVVAVGAATSSGGGGAATVSIPPRCC